MSKINDGENLEATGSEENTNELINFEEEILSLNIDDVSEQEEEIKQKIDKLADGTEILRDEEETEEKEVISDKNLRKLLEFTTGVKANLITDKDLEDIRNNEEELERLIRVSFVKSKFFRYFPKKNFGTAYKAERRKKNRQASRQRAVNRKNNQKSMLSKRH